MAYNITGVKTINELDSNSNISQSTIFIIGNGTDLKKCQYSDLSSRLDNDLNVNEKITNDVNDLKDEISLSVSDLRTSLINEIDVNFAKKDSLNNYYNKDEIENKITEINSKTIPVASTTTIGGFIVADDNTENEITSDNNSNNAKYPVKVFESSNKHQSNVAYVEIDNKIVSETNENVATIQSNLNNLTNKVNTITESTVTSETTNKLSNDINIISTDLNDTIDGIDNLVNELYGEDFNRNAFLSVHYISSEVISSLSGTYELCSDNIVNDTVTLKYQDSQWYLIIDNDDSASISVISRNVQLSTFGLSVKNINDNIEITSFLSNDIIDIELQKDKQTGNYTTCYIDSDFTNGEKTGGDIGTLLNSITNDWKDISSATIDDKKIPTAYAIKEYINQVLKSIV